MSILQPDIRPDHSGGSVEDIWRLPHESMHDPGRSEDVAFLDNLRCENAGLHWFIAVSTPFTIRGVRVD